MVIVQGYPPAPAPAPVDGPARPDLLGWCTVRAWALVIVGSGLCGLLALNLVSVVLVVYSVPVGLLVGVVIGYPLAHLASRQLTGRPVGVDPTPVVRSTKLIGVLVAVGINGATNLLTLQTVVQALAGGASVSWGWVVALVVAAPVAVAASGLVGWSCGATLAQAYLVEIGHPAAAQRRAARRFRPWR